jgi:K+-transporting ATPase A subunit
MKTLIAATALIASVASASAMTPANGEIERYVGAAEAATLSDAEVLTALNFIHSSDSESEKRAFVRGLVN